MPRAFCCLPFLLQWSSGQILRDNNQICKFLSNPLMGLSQMQFLRWKPTKSNKAKLKMYTWFLCPNKGSSNKFNNFLNSWTRLVFPLVPTRIKAYLKYVTSWDLCLMEDWFTTGCEEQWRTQLGFLGIVFFECEEEKSVGDGSIWPNVMAWGW